jgi:hypothetical protein
LTTKKSPTLGTLAFFASAVDFFLMDNPFDYTNTAKVIQLERAVI